MRLPSLRALRAHAVTVLLIGFLVAVYAVVAGACAAADLSAPNDCTNEMQPATFRLILTTGDTLPRATNHYLEPHTNTFTFHVYLSAIGRTLTNPVTYSPGYCITALDSAAWTTNHTLRWID